MNRSITANWGSAASRSSAANSHSNPSSSRSSPSRSISINPPPPGSAAAAALAAAIAAQKQEKEQQIDSDVQLEGSSSVIVAQDESNPAISTSNSSPLKGKGRELDQDSSSDPINPIQSTSTKRKSSRFSSSNQQDPSSSSTTTSSKRLKSNKSSSSSTLASSNRESDLEKYAAPNTPLSSLGGLSSSITTLLELVALPLLHPEIYSHTGVRPPLGVLLHGPPGCGKTLLAGALAHSLNVPFLSLSSPSIVSGTSGESERTLRDTFEKARKLAPAILFLDEIDAITGKRENAAREMERRIVAQLLTLMDDLSWPPNSDTPPPPPVIIIGATNRPDSLDPALRRAGRFDHEIALGVPDEAGREEILRALLKPLRLSGEFDFKALAKMTPGYVGADLQALTSAAGVMAVKRMFGELVQIQKQNGDQSKISEVKIQELIKEKERLKQVEEMDGIKVDGEIKVDDDKDVEMNWEGGNESHQPEINPGSVMESAEATPGTLTPNETQSEKVITSTSTSTSPLSSLASLLPTSLLRTPISLFLLSYPSTLTPNQLNPLHLTPQDFTLSLPSIQPSSQREGFATIPDVTWSDIGALHSTRDELAMAIVHPIRRPELFESVGVSASSGVLLWGPPGCGKTLLAKAVANESGANFISVKGPELLNKYVGESERAVRQVFARARTSSPCVIFFDELDALVPRRDDALSESSSRVVNTLLTELDGLETRVQTFIIGATNRPDMIDPAMCRPGRLDKLLYVDLPNAEERFEILKTISKKTPLGSDVDLKLIAEEKKADGYSGADLAALVREAATLALREALTLSERENATRSSTDSFNNGNQNQNQNQNHYPLNHSFSDLSVVNSTSRTSPTLQVNQIHFLKALQKVSPSVSNAQRRKYEALRRRLAGGPIGTGVNVSNEGNGKEGEGEDKIKGVASGRGIPEGNGSGEPEMAI